LFKYLSTKQKEMKKTILLILLLSLGVYTSAQNFNDKIDLLFNEWNQPNHPGGVVSIMIKNEIVFSKAYGLANIQYNVRNTTETIFNIGSVSKQFTAIGIVLLHLEDKLSIDDDIRKYLPELDDFGKKITIRHLLHHTSGLRSSPELFGLAGWRDGDAITTEDAYRYLCKQKDLNFEPGKEFMYSNSGYILLAKIIESVTKQEFKTWMNDNIFTPLDMTNTFVDENNSNMNPNVATPYYRDENSKFFRAENSSLEYGASNIYSTAMDLTKWMKSFYNPSKEWKQAFEILQSTDTLTNGKVNIYAFGVIVDDFFGNKRVQHTGGVPGFLSFAMSYPKDELTIVMLTNFHSREINHLNIKLTQLFLKNKLKQEKPIKAKAINTITLDSNSLKNHLGDYWNDKDNYARKIHYENDTLWYLRSNGKKSPLIPISKNEFQMGGLRDIVKVKFEHDNQKRMTVIDGDNPPANFIEFDSTPTSTEEIESYIGSFYSTELETTYMITIKGGKLMGYHSRHGEFEIQVIKKDITNWSEMAFVKYTRDENNNIIGFSVSLNRINNLWFDKK
jgi:CubicO group peptidase (beta-lactamase class C family)